MKDYYKLYLDDTLKLAKTIVIKSEDSVTRVNDFIKLKYGEAAVDKYDLTSWKYYRNICGLYHPTDTMMSVTSLDTLEIINFTQANLSIHTATKEAYQYGTRYYYNLVATYPEQEQLILGILYPADMETAIEAEEYSILSYPKELVEPQEITLFIELEAWLKRYLVRWHVRAFGLSDSLYPVAQHAILYLNLVPRLLNLRLKRCKSNETHSFHIRMYLASHGKLDRYLDYLTLKQALFLYRNIAYLEHNSGQSNIFTWLIERLLSERYIPIAEYSARHLSTFDEGYYPEYRFRKKPLNTQYNVPEKDYFSLEELLVKETPMAPLNKIYSEDQFGRIDNQFTTSNSSVVQTKDLESSMVDYTDATPYRLTDVLLNHWAYLSAKGLYNVITLFKDPKTSEIRSLSTEDAFIYLIYLTLKSIGVDIQYVPKYLASRVQLDPKPSVAEVIAMTDGRVINQTKIINWIFGHQPTIKKCFSKSAFFNLSHSIHSVMLEQWYLVSRTEHLYQRALISNAINRMYCDQVITFSSNDRSYSEWLAEKELPEYDYTNEEVSELITAIFQSASGYNIEPNKLIKNIQKAMLAVLTQLSSYSIQIIPEINTSPIVPLNWAAIRLGDFKCQLHNERLLPVGVRVLDQFTESKQDTLFIVNRCQPTNTSSNQQNSSIEFIRNIKFNSESGYDIQQYISLSPLIIIADYPERDETVQKKTAIVGYETYLNLTETQQRSLIDIYQGSVDIDYEAPVLNLADVIMYDTLPTIKYLSLPNIFLES